MMFCPPFFRPLVEKQIKVNVVCIVGIALLFSLLKFPVYWASNILVGSLRLDTWYILLCEPFLNNYEFINNDQYM